jgi:3-hydroxy-D-aspartate aldolase
MNIAEVPTPALLLDAGVFESNIRTMAGHAERSGKKLRPHAKAHKCVAIAKRQIEAGAAGVCAATVSEAELMTQAEVPGVLLTSPVADPGKCKRIAALALAAPDITVVVDHEYQVQLYAEAADRAGVTINVLIDLDLGDHRTGIAPGEPALQLANTILANRRLSFKGLQAYSVRASHLSEKEGRSEYSSTVLSQALEMRILLESHGIETQMISGASTGSYAADAALPYITELQAGSYALMDVAYARIGGIEFGHALTVLATVISANHTDRVTVDAGFKAFSTDRPFGPEVLDQDGARYDWAGDEFGYVFLDQAPDRIRLGERLRFIPPHCDPTVNLYDRIHLCRGDEVQEIWPVMDRYHAH